METVKEQFHLINLIFRDDSDLPLIREKTQIIGQMCHFSPAEVDQLTEGVLNAAKSILKNGTGKICWSLIRSSEGNGGMEVSIENQAAPQKNLDLSDEPLQAKVLKNLKKVTDFLEVDGTHGSAKVILRKWGPHLSFKKMHEKEKKIIEKIFAKTDENTRLENLRAKHEELLKMWEERSRQYEEMNRLNVELFKLNRDLEALAAERATIELALKVAHEIRNPATIIAGLSRSLAKKMLHDEKTQLKSKKILEQVKKLEEIVHNFENLTSQRKFFLKSENLIEMTNDCVEILKYDFARKGVELNFKPKESLLMIDADKAMLKVAFIHILRNALEACESGGAVTIRINKTHKSYKVQIKDNGVGIPQEKLTHIFEPFVTTKTSRTGLGLPIVKQIVEEHRGRIEIKSQVGQETTVNIEFPIFAVSKI